MNKTIKERVEAYKRYEHENILLAMAETEELMVQISRATTLDQAQELSRAWLLVFNSDQPPVVVSGTPADTTTDLVFNLADE